jgi:hypothetical protein
MAVSLEPQLLDDFPKLNAFYNAMLSTQAFEGIREYPMYFHRNP